MARGAVSDEHPLNMGYADPALNKAIHTAFQEADLFLVIGKRLDYRLALGGARLFPPAAKFIQIDIHAQELGMNRKLDVAICADAKASLCALTEGGGREALDAAVRGSIACAGCARIGRRAWRRSRRTARSDASGRILSRAEGSRCRAT